MHADAYSCDFIFHITPTYEYAIITHPSADEHLGFFSYIFAIAYILLRMILDISSDVHMCKFL